jgi:hypothetical protein
VGRTAEGYSRHVWKQPRHLGCLAPAGRSGVAHHRFRTHPPGKNRGTQLLHRQGADRPLSVKPEPAVTRRGSRRPRRGLKPCAVWPGARPSPGSSLRRWRACPTIGGNYSPARTQARHLGCLAPLRPGSVADHRVRAHPPGGNGGTQLLRRQRADRPLSVKPEPGVTRHVSHVLGPSAGRRATPPYIYLQSHFNIPLSRSQPFRGRRRRFWGGSSEPNGRPVDLSTADRKRRPCV